MWRRNDYARCMKSIIHVPETAAHPAMKVNWPRANRHLIMRAQ